MDFHNGLDDLNKKVLRFIGNPEKRIEEDPLRIIRAYRFQLSLDFDFDNKTEQALTNSQSLIKTLSAKRIESELNKISDENTQQKLREVIHKFTWLRIYMFYT